MDNAQRLLKYVVNVMCFISLVLVILCYKEPCFGVIWYLKARSNDLSTLGVKAGTHAEMMSKAALFHSIASNHLPRSSYYIAEKVVSRVGNAKERERLIRVGIKLARNGVDPGRAIELLGVILPRAADSGERDKLTAWVADYSAKVSGVLADKGMDPVQALAAMRDLIPNLMSWQERNMVYRLGMSLAEQGRYPGEAIKALGKVLPMIHIPKERDEIFRIGINLARRGIDPSGMIESVGMAMNSGNRVSLAKEMVGYFMDASITLKTSGVDPEYAIRILGKVLPGLATTRERLILTQELINYFINIPIELRQRKSVVRMLGRIFPDLKNMTERDAVIELGLVLERNGMNPAPSLNSLQGALIYYERDEDRRRVINIGLILAQSGINPANMFDALLMLLELAEHKERLDILDMTFAIAEKGEDPARLLNDFRNRRSLMAGY